MDAARLHTLLHDHLRDCSLELLRDIGAEFTEADASSWLPDITAIIGFAGDGIAGSLALSTSHSCLGGLAKLGNTEMSEDWLGELSNQLLGRMKRRLASHGASFGLSTPVVIAGERLRLSTGQQKEPIARCALGSDIGRVQVLLEIDFRDGFALTEESVEDGSLIEGEALLF